MSGTEPSIRSACVPWKEHNDRNSACAAAEAMLLERGALTAHEAAYLATGRRR